MKTSFVRTPQWAELNAVNGDRDVAIEHLEKALGLNPDDEGLKLVLEGVLAYRRGGT